MAPVLFSGADVPPALGSGGLVQPIELRRRVVYDLAPLGFRQIAEPLRDDFLRAWKSRRRMRVIR